MLKRILAASAVLASVALAAAPASAAGGGSANVTVSGTVADACSSTNASTTKSLSSNLAGPDGFLIADNVNGAVGPYSVGTVWCNGLSAKVSVAATKLQNTSSTLEAGGFTSHIDYEVTSALTGADGNAHSFLAKTIGSVVDQQQVGPFVTTTASGTIQNASATGRLVAGTYTGLITVTVSPS